VGDVIIFMRHSGNRKRPLRIESRSHWENGYSVSINVELRDELLDREIFYTLREAQILIEGRRQHYNTGRPHSALDYRPRLPRHAYSPRSPCSGSGRWR